MRFVVGIWVTTIGYAVAFAGISFFEGNPISLTAALGLPGSSVPTDTSGGPTTWLGPSGQITGTTPGTPSSLTTTQLKPITV
jgi:hypothetical protein